jgi:hypothetical protein
VNVDFDAKPLKKIAAKLENFSRKIQPAMDSNDAEFAVLLLKEVKQRASGRPGPNIVTGRYVNSFFIVDGRVVNPSPQTRRLEYGYIGVDSAGRMYNQPPFPHFRPALAAMRPVYVASIPKVFWKTWRSA